MTNGIKIVTSIYELNHEEQKGGMVYKSFPLTSLTIRDIIFDEFKYVIYTNKYANEKYEISQLFNKPNVEVKIQELDSEFYTNIINPVRVKRYEDGDIWERFYSVKNYVEVIFNKFKHLLEECDESHNTVWIDAGLFGTSCNDGWRDYMVEIAHTPNFINKINQKINEREFICLRGLGIPVNIDLKSRLVEHFGVDFQGMVPGALFGGTKDKILKILSGYEEFFKSYVEKYNELVSEQEILSVLTHKNNVNFYDFDDWLDLQKSLLNIMEVYEESKYLKDSCELYSTKYLDRYKRK